MKHRNWLALLLAGVMTLGLLTGCGGTQSAQGADVKEPETENAGETVGETAEETAVPDETVEPEDDGILRIARQGLFSAGGTVTEPVEGEYDPAQSWMDPTLAGTTAHVDHANVFYQIPADNNGHPIVYLHGYGQSRMSWMTDAPAGLTCS